MDFSNVADELRDYPADGSLQLMDLMALSEPSRAFLTWVIRQGRVSVTSCQTFTNLSPSAASDIVNILVKRKFLVVSSDDDGQPSYQLRIVSRTRGRTILEDW